MGPENLIRAASLFVLLLYQVCKGQVFDLGNVIAIKSPWIKSGAVYIWTNYQGGSAILTQSNSEMGVYNIPQIGPTTFVVGDSNPLISSRGESITLIQPRADGLYFRSAGNTTSASWRCNWDGSDVAKVIASGDVLTVTPLNGSMVTGQVWHFSTAMPSRDGKPGLVVMLNLVAPGNNNPGATSITYQGVVRLNGDVTATEIIKTPNLGASDVLALQYEFSLDVDGTAVNAAVSTGGSFVSKVVRYSTTAPQSCLVCSGQPLGTEVVTTWPYNNQLPSGLLDPVTGDYVVPFAGNDGWGVARFIQDQPQIVPASGSSVDNVSFGEPYLYATEMNSTLGNALIGNGENRVFAKYVNGLTQLPDGSAVAWIGGVESSVGGCGADAFSSGLDAVPIARWSFIAPCILRHPVGLVRPGASVTFKGHNMFATGLPTAVVDAKDWRGSSRLSR